MEINQLKKKIIELHNSMREIVLKTGMKDTKFEYPVREINLLDEDELISLCYWLEDIHKKEYKKYKAIRGLLPEEIWERYVLYGKRDLAEQILLREAGRQLIERWKISWRKQKV